VTIKTKAAKAINLNMPFSCSFLTTHNRGSLQGCPVGSAVLNYKITQKILFLGAISPETREVAAALTVRAARAPNIRFVSRANKLSWVYIRRSRLPSKNRHSRMRSNCALRIQKRTNAPHNRSSPLCGLPLRSIDASDQAHAGSPTVSSNPTAISSIIAVKRGTSSSISPGA